MTNTEIKERIDANYEKMKELATYSFFTLNKEVSEIMKENEGLQKQCIHEYEDGFCKYCYMNEPKED